MRQQRDSGQRGLKREGCDGCIFACRSYALNADGMLRLHEHNQSDRLCCLVDRPIPLRAASRPVDVSTNLTAAQAGRVDSVLLYISDHGESLGERNIYLHGLPKMLAPREQTHVPMLAWLSTGAWQRLGVNEAALRQLAAQPLTHDNLAPTLLGLLGVRTSAVRVELDLMALARRAAPP